MAKPIYSNNDPDYDDDREEECFNCGGEGFVLDDCWEDTCPCADPESEHDVIPCPVCS